MFFIEQEQIMSHINGGTIIVVLAVIGILFLGYSLRNGWRQVFARDDSPLAQAKRDWCKAWNGTSEKLQAEKEWDELGATEINGATTLSELCNACERVFWYSHHGKYKKRESEVLLKAYADKKKDLKDELREKELQAEAQRSAQALKTKNEGRRHAPPLKKLPGAGKNFHFHSGR